MNNSAKILFVLAAGWLTTTAFAQDRIHYTGKELSNPAYHDGQLSPVVGVHNIQLVLRTAMDGLIITSRCSLIGMASFSINTWQTLLMNTYRLHRLF